jgi:hypothetical protein
MRASTPAFWKLFKRGGIALAAVALTLAGCGGGSSSTASSGSTAVTGKFVDATVVGLGYKCGTSTALSGTTNASGQFTCNSGDAIAFYVGGIKLGSIASPQAVVTPLDFVGVGGSPSDPKVVNIVRFLMSVSSTAASSGTLTIDPAVATAAANSAIDFSQDAPSNLDSVITLVKPAGATVATALEATAHLSDSINGLFAGSFSGSYSGTASGTWTITINSQGTVTGTATDSSNGTMPITGSMGTSFGTGSTYAFTGAAGSDTWTGKLNMNTRDFSGTWSGGTFTGKAAALAGVGSTVLGNMVVTGIGSSARNGTYAPDTVTQASGVDTDINGSTKDGKFELDIVYASNGTIKSAAVWFFGSNASITFFGCNNSTIACGNLVGYEPLMKQILFNKAELSQVTDPFAAGGMTLVSGGEKIQVDGQINAK